MKDTNTMFIRTAVLIVVVTVIGLICRHINPIIPDKSVSVHKPMEKLNIEGASPNQVISRSLIDTKMITLNFDNAKDLANQVLNLIYNRYELYDDPGSQFFLTANNYGEIII
jgi:hypothetical protein